MLKSAFIRTFLLFFSTLISQFSPGQSVNDCITIIGLQKISSTQGGFTGTLPNNNIWGSAMCSIGDLNNDGVDDIAVGSSRDDDGGTDRGAIWVLFMNNNGTVNSHQKISDLAGNFIGTLDDNDHFGGSITNLGDLNNDGVTDLAVGAYDDDDGGNNRGAVWILFMNNNGTVNSHQKISDLQGGFTGVLDDADQFGEGVGAIGDLNNDGNEDLLVGAHNDDDGGPGRGALWVLFLNANGTVSSHQKISDTQGSFTGLLANNDRFGTSVAAIGDINGDNIPDLATGAKFDDNGAPDAGAIWVLFMNTNGTVAGQRKISATQGGFSGTLSLNDHFGFHVDGLGDLNGDGVNDILVGARNDDDGGVDRGASWILYMNSNGTVIDSRKISDTQGNFTGGLDNSDKFGTAVASIGDLDGNGFLDYAVGANLDDDGGTDRGAVWIVFNGDTCDCNTIQATTFQGVMGLAQNEHASDVETTADGGFIIAGATNSVGAGNDDFYVRKVNGCRQLEWEYTYGGTGQDWASTVIQTLDGGYAVGGYTNGFGNVGPHDDYLVKLNTQGVVEWSRRLGGTGGDYARFTRQTADSGFALCGYTGFGAGANDIHVFKLDQNGATQWARAYGNNANDFPQGFEPTADGGYIISGYRRNYTSTTNYQAFLCKINGAGVVQWFKTYSANLREAVNGVVEMPNGDFVAVGTSTSSGAGLRDVMVIRVNSAGQLQWSRTFGGTSDDFSVGVDVTPSGDIAVFGHSESFTTGVGRDLYLLKIDGSGNLLWSRNYGGPQTDYRVKAPDAGFSQTANGGFLLTGATQSFGWGGNDDVYLIKTDSMGEVECNFQTPNTQSGNITLTETNIVPITTIISPTNSVVNTIVNNVVLPDTILCQAFLDTTDHCIKVIGDQKIGEIDGNFQTPLDPGDRFGQDVCSIGDWNGDGVGDIAVGANQDDDGGLNRGAIYLLYMNSNGTVQSEQKISSTSGGFTGVPHDAFGSAVDTIGDLNNDGIMDLLVGEGRGNDGGIRRGAVWILFMNANGTVNSHQKISDTQGGFTGVLDNDDRFGGKASALGDLNGDGVEDILVCAPFDDDGGADAGAVWILFLNTNGTVASHQKLSATSGGVTGIDPGDNFGISARNLGDLDNDGLENIAVGARFDDDGGSNRGAVYIFNINSNGTVANQLKISSTQGNFNGDLDNDDRFGTSIGNLGDLNSDGYLDIVVGAYLDDDGSPNSGAGWILCLDSVGLPLAEKKFSNTQSNWSGGVVTNDGFTWGVNGVGDIDGNGVMDIGSGAPLHDAGGTDKGSLWIINLEDSCLLCPVVADFIISDSTPCPGDTVFFTNQSTDATAFEWYVDSVLYSTATDTFWIANDSGTIEVKLIAMDSSCIDSASESLLLIQVAWSLGNDTTVCLGDTVNLAPSLPGSNYLWSTGDTTANIQVDSSGVFTLQMLDSNSCPSSDTIQVTQVNPPTFTMPQDSMLCTTVAFALQPQILLGSGQTYSWSPAGLLSSSTIPNPTILQDTSSTYYLTVTDSLGCTATDSVFVGHQPDPVVTLTNDTAICLGDTIQLQAGGGDTYSWTPGSSLSSTVGPNPSAFPTSTQTYQVVVSDSIGCSSTDSVTITVLTPPSVQLMNDTSICSGDSIILTVPFDSNLTYSWQNSSTDTTFVANSAGLYWLSVSNSCGSAIDSFNLVSLYPSPMVNLGNDTSLCAGDTLILNAGNGSTYVWNPSGSGPNYTVLNSGTYAVTVTDTLGCSGSDSIIVTYVNPPSVNLGNDTTICSGDSIQLSAGGTSLSYVWSNGDTTGSIWVSSGGSYSVTVTNSTGCTASDTLLVTSVNSPIVSLGNDTSICDSSGFLLQVNQPGASYLWSTGSSSGNIQPDTSGIYWVTVTDANGCQTTDSISITVVPNPTVNLGSDTFLCPGDSITLSAGNAGSTYLWNNGDTNQFIIVNTVGTYSVTVTNSTGCTGSDTIQLMPGVNPVIGLPDSISFCDGDSALLFAGNPGGSYQWSNGLQSVGQYVHQSGTYWVQVTNANGCFNSDTTVATVLSNPTVNLGNDTVFCSGDTLYLNASYPGTTALWSTGSTLSILPVWNSASISVTITTADGCTAQDNINITVDDLINFSLGPDLSVCEGEVIALSVPNGYSANWSNGSVDDQIVVGSTGTYSVTVTNGNCQTQDDLFLEVIPLPTVELPNDTGVCLNLSETGFPLFAGPDLPSVDYLWSTGSTEHTILVQTPGTYSVVATNTGGCIAWDSVKIENTCESQVYFPSAFTPNGDGLNDVFLPQGFQVEEYEIMIFNRWGELLFRSSEITQGWDGTFQGQLSPQGVYVWRAKYRIKDKAGFKRKYEPIGKVTLLRGPVE